MKNKRFFLTLLAITLSTTALALTGSSIAQKRSDEKATVSSPSGLKEVPADLNKDDHQQPAQTQQGSAPAADQEVPIHVVYDQMFRHIKELNKKADEEARQGKNGEHFRTLYKRLARLEDPQSQVLDRIARDVDREIEPLNKKAIAIVRSVRARHPEGKLAQGELPPEPPAELRVLADQRRQVILQARDELRASIGDEAFQRFDDFVKERIKSGIRRLNNSPASQGTTP